MNHYKYKYLIFKITKYFIFFLDVLSSKALHRNGLISKNTLDTLKALARNHDRKCALRDIEQLKMNQKLLYQWSQGASVDIDANDDENDDENVDTTKKALVIYFDLVFLFYILFIINFIFIFNFIFYFIKIDATLLKQVEAILQKRQLVKVQHRLINELSLSFVFLPFIIINFIIIIIIIMKHEKNKQNEEQAIEGLNAHINQVCFNLSNDDDRYLKINGVSVRILLLLKR